MKYTYFPPFFIYQDYLEIFNCFYLYVLILYFVILKFLLVTKQGLNIILLQLEQSLLARRCCHVNDPVSFRNNEYMNVIISMRNSVSFHHKGKYNVHILSEKMWTSCSKFWGKFALLCGYNIWNYPLSLSIKFSVTAVDSPACFLKINWYNFH